MLRAIIPDNLDAFDVNALPFDLPQLPLGCGTMNKLTAKGLTDEPAALDITHTIDVRQHSFT
jgi:hypothetical protein